MSATADEEAAGSQWLDTPPARPQTTKQNADNIRCRQDAGHEVKCGRRLLQAGRSCLDLATERLLVPEPVVH